MDKDSIASLKSLIKCDIPVRLVDSHRGFCDSKDEKVKSANSFLFNISNFFIEYVYYRYERVPDYRLLTDKFIIINTGKTDKNWLKDRKAFYECAVGEWSNLNPKDKNVYKYSTAVMIKYANYAYQTYNKINKYLTDDKNGIEGWPDNFYFDKNIKYFNPGMAHNPTFLGNLRTQLELVR